jgi:hypothetical protein
MSLTFSTKNSIDIYFYNLYKTIKFKKQDNYIILITPFLQNMNELRKFIWTINGCLINRLSIIYVIQNQVNHSFDRIVLHSENLNESKLFIYKLLHSFDNINFYIHLVDKIWN